MNPYTKYILPKIIDEQMSRQEIKIERPSVIRSAEGVVVEIGFGSGHNLPYYKNITKLFAVDPSRELFNLAKERVAAFRYPLEYLPISAEKMPFLDKSIDVVVSTWNLCTIPDVMSALHEAYRILKPGGTFVFSEHGKSDRPQSLFAQKILNPISVCCGGGCRLDREIDAFIKNAGFDFYHLQRNFIESEPLYFEYKGIAVKRS